MLLWPLWPCCTWPTIKTFVSHHSRIWRTLPFIKTKLVNSIRLVQVSFGNQNNKKKRFWENLLSLWPKFKVFILQKRSFYELYNFDTPLLLSETKKDKNKVKQKKLSNFVIKTCGACYTHSLTCYNIYFINVSISIFLS